MTMTTKELLTVAEADLHRIEKDIDDGHPATIELAQRAEIYRRFIRTCRELLEVTRVGGKPRQSTLRHVQVRKVLTTVAQTLTSCETEYEAKSFLQSLAAEAQLLADGDLDSLIYRQAASTIEGAQSYGLQRIGYRPEQVKE